MFDERAKRNLIRKLNTSANEMRCWIWEGYTSNGYGKIRINKKLYSVHRVMAAICKGLDIEDKSIYVCHRCDNTLCCYPDHLYLGNALTNAGDRDERKKSNLPRGDEHYAIKLKSADIEKIFKLSASGKQQKEIAAIFNVNKGTIQHVLVRKTWKHIEIENKYLYKYKNRKRNKNEAK